MQPPRYLVRLRDSIKSRKILFAVLLLLLLGFAVPERRLIPVSGASEKDWNRNSFWYEPWGSSGVHKGIDIFARQGTAVVASNHMIVLYRGNLSKGGNVLLALGPKWRLHYYAHLQSFDRDAGVWLSAGEPIGGVGSTGNAQGKAPHLHYSIVSMVPLPWRIDLSSQGYKKAFYLDPSKYLRKL